ncbi:hypothetical protein AGMMS49960_03630 [Betaproteobacteria bacterium]|nr:hypothetical protein AGMMS49543_02430 [Betaproteobacteria bacterium]GHT99129.1 hypothetical protein AGMMS49960_03630 [Betaproteobacteria bacterium]
MAWDGICLPHDHPFWQTHFAPNGFGCCCRIIAVSAPGKGDITEPPEGWDEIDPATGEQKGIGKGWGYAPGASEEEELRWIVENKMAKLPGPLAQDFLAQVSEAGVSLDAGALASIQLAKLAGDARAYVVGEGKRTGYEYLAIHDEATGKELGRFTSADSEQVAIPEEVKKVWDNKDAALVLQHNHPGSVSLSSPDLAHLSHVGVSRVVAYGHDGSSFAATRGADIGRMEQVIEAAKNARAQQLALLMQRGLTLTGFDAHLLNMALDRAGIIRYESKLDAKRNKVYIKDKAAIDAAVDEITHAINRARP